MKSDLTVQEFVNVIFDEAETLRDMMNGYYNIETGQTEDFEKEIGHIVGTRRNRWLRTLHSPFNRIGIKFAGTEAGDKERHAVFSRIFDRPIFSADDITNIEAWAWNRCVGKYNERFAIALVVEVRNTFNASV